MYCHLLSHRLLLVFLEVLFNVISRSYNLYWSYGIYGIIIIIHVMDGILVTLFIYKLIQVYQNVSNTDSLIKIITKITILSITSVICSMIYFVLLVISIKFKDNLHVKMTRDIIHIISIYVNFICILFSYNCFENNYQYLCGPTNRLCQHLWYGMVGGNKSTSQQNETSRMSSRYPSRLRETSAM